jgi:DNA-binding NtrC family response regulator
VSERILITEDDEDLAFVIREALIRQGYEAEVAPTAGALLDKLKAGSYDLILLDVRLPDMDGLDAIPRCRDLAPETPIIVMTAHGTRQIAMNAVTRGAYDFFTKPLKMAEFQVVVSRALDRRRLQQQVKVLREGQSTGGFEELVGKSESLKRVIDMAQRAAPTDLTVLIHGESGTGKELMARAIHRLSSRKDGPFIPVNCAAIPEGLLESELFGHERGAFTGAIRSFSTRSATCRWRCRPRYCACFRSGSSSGSGARARSGPTCASSPRRTRTSRRWRRRAGSDPICSTGCRACVS